MVIPLSLLQSGLSGEGFRRLILPDGDSLALRWIGDFSHFSPFSGVGTTVGALLFQKGEKTRWPVEVLRWERIPRLEIANRPPSDKFPRIDGKPVRQIPLQAEPSDRSKPESALRFFDPKKRETPFPASREVDRDVYPPIPDSTEDSPYVARLGVNAAGGGGVFWLRPEGPEPEGDYSGLIRVRNLADVGKRKVPEVVAELESTLLYPLVRWRDVDRFRVKSSGLILLPQDPLTRRGIPMEVMATRYPRTLAYLEIFRQMLESRAAYRKFQSRAPYWSLYNVCQETLSPIKVVWRRMDLHFRATVLLPDAKGRPLLPQETLAFVAVETIEEADYLAAVLNSPVTRQKLTSFSLAGSKGFGSPGVLPLLGIPRFDPHAPLHRDLADYGKTRRETP